MIRRRIALYAGLMALFCLADPAWSGRAEARSPFRAFDEQRRVIHDRPITFTEKRVKLTLDYMRRHCDPRSEGITIVPRIVVIHWTAIGTLSGAFAYFDRETLQPDRADIRHGGALNVSAHYLVDRDGAVYRLMPDTRMARHVIGLNHCSIGIENVGGPSRPLTEKQLEANAWLVAHLLRTHPTIEHLIGHHEYLSFRNGPLWRSLDPRYVARKKIDPGESFMKALRKRLGRGG